MGRITDSYSSLDRADSPVRSSIVTLTVTCLRDTAEMLRVRAKIKGRSNPEDGEIDLDNAAALDRAVGIVEGA